ncbi:hypothetical protein QTP88_007093 [Uroleucon formosanum]
MNLLLLHLDTLQSPHLLLIFIIPSTKSHFTGSEDLMSPLGEGGFLLTIFFLRVPLATGCYWEYSYLKH